MKPKNFYTYDDLIQKWAKHYGLPWKLIKAQVWQESSFRPDIDSKCGAAGLMQLMPATDYMLDHDIDGHDVEGNLENGIRYDRWLYDKLWEIKDQGERLKCMLAAYNGGPGYVNKAMELAYAAEFGVEMPAGHKNARPGFWQTWARLAIFLATPGCQVKGKLPDVVQIIGYIDGIMEKLLEID